MEIVEDNCFYPDDILYFDPSSMGFKKQELWVSNRLNCWFVMPKAQQKNAIIVHLHGNAENMTSHITGLIFLLEMGYPLFAFDYSGYGKSKGRPTLAGIQRDAEEVFNYIHKRPEVFGNIIFGFGQSMGAYTLARILPSIPWLKGAVLEAGLTSFYDLFREAYPQYSCRVPEKGLSTLDTLINSHVPKLFIHGTKDEVVPYSHSMEMYKIAAGPKDLLILDGVGHIDAMATVKVKDYVSKVVSFIEEHMG